MLSTTILFVTMGEDTTIDSLNSVLRYAKKPYNLLVWNNGANGVFPSELGKYSDNVINCTKNQGLLEAMGYAFLMSLDDVVILTCAGLFWQENTYESLLAPFEDEKVGIVAEYQFPTEENVLCTREDIPEGVEAYGKKMINEIGSLCPSFKTWGTSPTELKIRAMRRGWKVIGIPKCVTHINRDGQGKETVDKELFGNTVLYNNFVFNIIEGKGFDYPWWRTDIFKQGREEDYELPLERRIN